MRDLHNFVGSRAFGVSIDKVTTEMRHRVKAMSYGLAYGLSAFGLAAQLGISRDEAKEQMEAYFARFGGVRDYLNDVVDAARRDEYTATVYGRRRYLPDLNSENWQRRQAAERMALNAPIQGMPPTSSGRDDQRPSQAARGQPAQPDAAAGARRTRARSRRW